MGIALLSGQFEGRLYDIKILMVRTDKDSCSEDGCRGKIMTQVSMIPAVLYIVGRFSNDDSDGNEKLIKKAVGLITKTTTLHVH